MAYTLDVLWHVNSYASARVTHEVAHVQWILEHPQKLGKIRSADAFERMSRLSGGGSIRREFPEMREEGAVLHQAGQMQAELYVLDDVDDVAVGVVEFRAFSGLGMGRLGGDVGDSLCTLARDGFTLQVILILVGLSRLSHTDQRRHSYVATFHSPACHCQQYWGPDRLYPPSCPETSGGCRGTPEVH